MQTEQERQRELLDVAMSAEAEARLDGPRCLYSRRLGKTLRDRLAAMGDQASVDHLDSELALVRALAEDALEVYDHSEQAAIAAGADPVKRAHVRLAAGNVVYAAIAQVRETAQVNARIKDQSKVDVRVLGPLVTAMQQAFDAELQVVSDKLRAAGIDPESLCDGVGRRLQAAQVPLLANAQAGAAGMTTLEPADAEAEAMDATVPRVDGQSVDPAGDEEAA